MNDNRVTITEANQNFSRVARQAEELGWVVIDKNGEDRFVLMTCRKFKRLASRPLWAIDSDGSVYMAEHAEGNKMRLDRLESAGGSMYTHTTLTVGIELFNNLMAGTDGLGVVFEELMADALSSDHISISRKKVDVTGESLEAKEAAAILDDFEDASFFSPDSVQEV